MVNIPTSLYNGAKASFVMIIFLKSSEVHKQGMLLLLLFCLVRHCKQVKIRFLNEFFCGFRIFLQ